MSAPDATLADVLARVDTALRDRAYYALANELRDAIGETTPRGFAAQWHQACETAAVLLGLPGGLSAREFVEAVQARRQTSQAPDELPSYDELLHQLHFASICLRKIRDEHPEHEAARLAGVALCQVADSRAVVRWMTEHAKR